MSEILIVDDDEALRRWEERVVREQGYSCDSACDAQRRARAAATEHLQARAARRQHAGRVRHRAALAHPPRASGGGGPDGHRRGQHQARDDGDRARRLRLSGQAARVRRAADQRRQRPAPLAQQSWRTAVSWSACRATVQERSHTLEDALQDLELSETKVWVSQAETIFRLARMVEFRDEETGHHLHRMSSYCEILARQIGFPAQRCELVRLASQLHDVGKVAVPDSILLKPGKLTPEEFEVIKGHAETGFQMLAGSSRGGRAARRADRPHPPRALGRRAAIPAGLPARTSRRRDASPR